jgi:hypothetical protein
MNKKLPLSIGILSWGDHPTLLNTLQSYQKAGLLDCATQVFIYFQEISSSDQEIAAKFGLTCFGGETNLGIAGGYREMLKYVNQPYYLFLENDWVILEENMSRVLSQFQEGEKLLQNHDVDVVRLRSRHHPGNPLYTAQFKGMELSRPEHLLDCLHWVANPVESFPLYIREISPGWFAASAKNANWTNNPHLVKTDWVKNELLPHLGNRDIERDLQKWWQETDYTVAQGEGIFTHIRI